MALRSEELRSIAPLEERYLRVRRSTTNLCRTLDPEDFCVQSMPSASPAKWHLAHTTWFFEQFILVRLDCDYSVFDRAFDYLFNSYYHTKGAMHPRPQRGLLTRPSINRVRKYREYVDDHMLRLVKRADNDEFRFLVEIGLHHEQQHQELLLTDIKHAFSCNPLEPALLEPDDSDRSQVRATRDAEFIAFETAIRQLGADGSGFCFDNETPRHDALVHAFAIANRPVTNREFRQFVDDGGYRNCALWLSDGWDWVNTENATRPLYWTEDLETEFTLTGRQPVDPDAPVCHVSFYEADAFARWAGARLPTEQEWETAAAGEPIDGNFVESGALHPRRGTGRSGPGLHQVFGDTWEWTRSAYAPYPGYAPYAGALGEYNGKFMSNQMVCRGGSCATPQDHVRDTYRNFFYPQERWQFFGLRLARDT